MSNNSKAIILCGGKGTRLKPLSDITNKHLIAVLDKPMIFYPLDLLKKLGFKDILIISGREHAGHFLQFLGSGADLGVNLHFRVQDKADGIAGALELAEDFIKDVDLFTVILGDNFFDCNIDLFKQNKPSIFVKKVDDPERFGVLDISKNNIVEKPQYYCGNLAVTGFYIYDKNLFNIIKDLKYSERGEKEITDVNNQYLKNNNLQIIELDGFWSDLGEHLSKQRTEVYLLKKYNKI